MTEERKLELFATLANVRTDLDEAFSDAMDKAERDRMRELRIELLDMAVEIDETAESFGWSIHDWELRWDAEKGWITIDINNSNTHVMKTINDQARYDFMASMRTLMESMEYQESRIIKLDLPAGTARIELESPRKKAVLDLRRDAEKGWVII